MRIIYRENDTEGFIEGQPWDNGEVKGKELVCINTGEVISFTDSAYKQLLENASRVEHYSPPVDPTQTLLHDRTGDWLERLREERINPPEVETTKTKRAKKPKAPRKPSAKLLKSIEKFSESTRAQLLAAAGY